MTENSTVYPFERTILPIAPRKSQVGITSNQDTTIPRWEGLSMRMDTQVRDKDSSGTICLRIVGIIIVTKWIVRDAYILRTIQYRILWKMVLMFQ